MKAKTFGKNLLLRSMLLSLSAFVFAFTAQAGFNQYSVGLNFGSDTTIGVDWFTPLGTWSSGANSDNFLPSTGDQIMMMGYLDNGTTATVTITNIPGAFTVNRFYVYVYALFDTANRGGTYSIVNPADSSTVSGPLFLNSDSNPTNYVQYPAGNTKRSGNYLVFRGLTNANI